MLTKNSDIMDPCKNFVFSSLTGSIDLNCCKSTLVTLLGVAIPLGALGLKLPQVHEMDLLLLVAVVIQYSLCVDNRYCV